MLSKHERRNGCQRVRRGSLEEFKVAEPNTESLHQFTDIVRPMFQQVRILANANNNLRQARDLLLPRLISGEVELPDLALDRAAAE